MTCPRCQGLIIREWVYSESDKVEGLKCLNCGFMAWLGYKASLKSNKPTQRGKYVRTRN